MFQKAQYCKDVNSPQLSYRANEFLVDFYFLVELEMLIIKFIWQCKKPTIANIVLKRKTYLQT